MGYIPSWEKLPHVVEARRFANKLSEAERSASGHIAVSGIQRYTSIALREREENHSTVEKTTDAQGSAADPTPDDRLVDLVEEIVNQLAQQIRNVIQAQQGKLVGLSIEVMAQPEMQQQRKQQQQHEEKDQQPSSMSSHAEEEKHNEEKQEDEDQQLVFMDEGRSAQQKELVEMEQSESHATSPLQPPPSPQLPLPHTTEAGMEEAEEPQATPPPPPPPPDATEAEIEEEQEKWGEHRGDEDLDDQRPPPSSLPLQPEIPLPFNDGGFRGDQVEETLIATLGSIYYLRTKRWTGVLVNG